VEVIEHDLFQLFVNLLLFPQNNISLSFYGRYVKLRVLEDVTDYVDGLGNVLLEAFGVVDSLLPRCVSVEVGTHIFDLKLQSVLGATTGTLERHVLEEMSGSVGGICLRSGPSIYPDTDCSGLSVWVRLCSDGKAI
jgi:hypothetical protein